MITNFRDAVQTVQSIHDNKPEKREEVEMMAFELGSSAWMSYANEEELKPVVDLLKGSCKEAFLRGLSLVITAPNNQESMIAANLRPYVAQELAAFEPSA